MHITIKGKHVDLGDALRAHVDDHLEQVVHKYFDRAIEGSVVLSREGHSFKADISVHPLKGVLCQASGEGPDAYVAVDSAMERVGKQLRRYKRRLVSTKHKVDDTPAQQYVIAAVDTDEEAPAEEQAPVVVAEMEAHIPVCTVSGAVMRLDLANAPALLFRNTAHGGLNMVYRRPDGNIGWVDPQISAVAPATA